ncbi:hypothetical protein AAHB66_10370 [Leclercia sp. S52]|uniref:hypothetical protein n=1 Tax=Leclercia sp. S52 TaxID=3138178 RepID=UPI00321B49C4
MEIILMRHGKPAFSGSSRVTSLEMADWISHYNLSDTGSDLPPQSSQALASSALQILSSPLPNAPFRLRISSSPVQKHQTALFCLWGMG